MRGFGMGDILRGRECDGSRTLQTLRRKFAKKESKSDQRLAQPWTMFAILGSAIGPPVSQILGGPSLTVAKEERAKVSVPLPLTGRRILITRAPHQASELAGGLQRLGATVILIPTIEIGPPSSFAALDSAIASLSSFEFIAFTSANAVRAFAERAGTPPAIPQATRIAVVGPATARALEAVGLHPDVMPSTFTAESLAQTLLPEVRSRSVLLMLAEDAPRTLADILTAGGAHVQVAAAYANRIPETSLTKIAALLSDPERTPHAVTFTSASTAKNLVALLQAASMTLPNSVARISIGPITSKALDDLHLPAHAEATEATIDALLKAVRLYLRSEP
jgi:uroporphyrinogen-III synthase